MSPRAKKATDDEVYGAVMTAVSRLGPERMTLADVAREVGMTAGALVQRFGSKRELLLAAVRAWNESAAGRPAPFVPRHASPLAALGEYAARAACAFRTPEELANQLAMLQLDVRDPDFRAEAAHYFRGEREMLRAWLDDAVAAGELRAGAPAEALARAVQAMVAGGNLLRGILEEKSAEDAAREELEALLGPYRA